MFKPLYAHSHSHKTVFSYAIPDNLASFQTETNQLFITNYQLTINYKMKVRNCLLLPHVQPLSFCTFVTHISSAKDFAATLWTSNTQTLTLLIFISFIIFFISFQLSWFYCCCCCWVYLTQVSHCRRGYSRSNHNQNNPCLLRKPWTCCILVFRWIHIWHSNHYIIWQ